MTYMIPFRFESAVWFIQMHIAWANTMLIYRVGKQTFGKSRVAEIAAYLYILNHSLVY